MERKNKLPTNFSSSQNTAKPITVVCCLTVFSLYKKFLFFFQVNFFLFFNFSVNARALLLQKFFCFYLFIYFSYLIQVEIVVGSRQSITFLLFSSQTLEQFVKDVVVALVGGVSHDPRLFQEILGDFGTGYRSTTSRRKKERRHHTSIRIF